LTSAAAPGSIDYATWGRRLYREAFAERRPIAGSLALTHRCNLRCIHCYVQPCRDLRELSTDGWKNLIDQLERAGCLFLVMTGGEPLLRDDFADIYTYARRRGFLVTVFTNGTRMGPDLISLFLRHPPHAVEISLYGTSAGTYRAVTGEAGARDAVYDALGRLASLGIPVRAKTVVLRRNRRELGPMKRRCEDLGVPFRFDTLVTPCLDGSLNPTLERLDEETLLRLDLEDEKRAAQWRGILEGGQRAPRASLYTCGAGRTSFHVTPDGHLSLCVSDDPVHDLAQGTFMDGWNGALRRRRMEELPDGHPCMGCRDQAFCGVCPPLARMETGSMLAVPRRLCRLGKERRRAFARARKNLKGDTGTRT
jgi:MoaA/NifB/PqqE/SkfB family radical SAM enzyme